MISHDEIIIQLPVSYMTAVHQIKCNIRNTFLNNEAIMYNINFEIQIDKRYINSQQVILSNYFSPISILHATSYLMLADFCQIFYFEFQNERTILFTKTAQYIMPKICYIIKIGLNYNLT